MGGIVNPSASFSGNGTSPGSITLKGDTNYTILATDRVVATNAAFTAARTWTLPAANSFSAGNSLYILDLALGVTSTNTLTVARAGADTIQGGANTITSTVIGATGFGLSLMSDGVSRWICPTTQAVGGNTTQTPFSGAGSGSTGFYLNNNQTQGIVTNGACQVIGDGGGISFVISGGTKVKVDGFGNLINSQAVADQSKSVQVPLTGFTITIANNISSLILDPAGTLATGTINLPATPIDGQIVRISSSQTITSLTVSGNGNTIKNAPTALTISATGSYGFTYIFHTANTTWYRLE